MGSSILWTNSGAPTAISYTLAALPGSHSLPAAMQWRCCRQALDVPFYPEFSIVLVAYFACAKSDTSHFAFRGAKSDISHFAARNRTLHISRRETGHSEMTKYQIEDGARHSRRVSGAG